MAIDPSVPPPNLEIDEASIQDVIENEPERLETAYQARIAEFDLPERVRARHILLRVPGPASDEMKKGLRQKAEWVLEELKGGAAFEDLALEYSGDPGSRDKGGDLGFFGRGRMVKQFEDVAFALEPGETSDVVETFHGYHIIRTEEKRPPEKTPLEDVREELARDLLAKEAAATWARQKTEGLVAALGEGKSLVDAAREAGIAIERPEPLVRRPDGRIPGLGAAPELQAAVFAASAEAGESLDRVFPVDGRSVLVQVLARRTPSEEDLAGEVEARRQQLLDERRSQVQQHWVDARSKQLSEDGQLLLDLTRLGAS